MPKFLSTARGLAAAAIAAVGCGHAGDGNVHGHRSSGSEKKKKLMTDIFCSRMELRRDLWRTRRRPGQTGYFSSWKTLVKISMRRITEL